MGKSSELLSLLKTGNSDAARRLIAKLKKSGKKKALVKELNVPDDNGQTVIHFCAAQNFVEFLQDLAELGASIDIADNKGYTPLHLAARSGRTSAVTALINKGADPNISSRTGDTALHLACSGGHATSVEALVSENANCTMLNVSGHTPLDLACQGGHAQVVSLLLRSGQFSPSYLQRSDMPHTALLLAAKQGHNECIGLLVKHGFDVNRKLPGSNSGTALHEAALYGKVDTVRYLLQCGADVQQTNAQGLTALDIVNMYTDPRSANQMKQVLQDALAHQARVRIAQQHAVQQHQPPPSHPHQPSHSHQPPSSRSHQPPLSHPHSSQHTPPTPHRQQSGFSYFQPIVQAQPAFHRQPSGEAPSSPQQHPRSTSHAHVGHQGQAAGGVSHHPQPSGRGYHQQQAAYTGSALSSHTRQPQTRDIQGPSSHQPQPQSGEYFSPTHSSQPAAAVSPSHVQHIYPRPGTPEGVRKTTPGIGGDLAAIIAAKAASRKPIVTSPTRREFPAEDERFTRSMTVGGESSILEARNAALRRHGSFSDRSSASPERSDPPTLPRRTQAGPPSFKPMPPPPDEPRDIQPGYRHIVASEEGSASDPLQRRTSPIKTASGERGLVAETDQRPRLKKAPPKAPPPAPAPASSVDNELMAKLLHRQNRMTEAEQAPPPTLEPSEQSPMADEEEEELKASDAANQQKPPPPPERKTPLLTSQHSQHSSETAYQHHSASADKVMETPAPILKPRIAKPPPSKPKEPETELSPWQMELAARRARMADHEKIEEEEQNKEEPSPVSKQQPQPSSTRQPPPAPRPKRSRDPYQEQFPPPPAQQPVPPPPAQQPVPPPPPAQRPVSPPPPAQQLPPSPPAQRPAPPPPVQEPSPPHRPAQEPVLPSQISTVPPLRVELSRPVDEQPKKQPVEQPSAPTTDVPAEFPQTSTVYEVKADHVSGLVASSTDQLSRSTSLSSLTTTTGAGSPQLPHVEHMAISDWLTSYKLTDYIPLLENNGYENTELLVDITQDELLDLGIQKVGHRKKLISALSNWPKKEHFFQTKPPSVSMWLSVLGLSQYEEVMLEAGYDDIDFICDITLDDLQDLGISKIGHTRRLMRGIGELTELMKSIVPIPTPVPVPQLSSLEQSSVNGHTGLPSIVADVLPSNTGESSEVSDDPRQNSSGQDTQGSGKIDFGKMKSLLERKMGANRASEDIQSSGEESGGTPRTGSHSPSTSPQVQRKTQTKPASAVAPPVPKRTPLAVQGHELQVPFAAEHEKKIMPAAEEGLSELPPQLPPKKGRKRPPPSSVGVPEEDMVDGAGLTWKKYSVEDITAALDDVPSGNQEDMAQTQISEREKADGSEQWQTMPGQNVEGSEFDQLGAALDGFEPEIGQNNKPAPPEPEPDQLLADIDDMLADLTTHLDFMIPGPSS